MSLHQLADIRARLARYQPGAMGGDHVLNPALRPQPPYRPAAVLIPLLLREDGVHVVFTLRTAHLHAHAGQVSFPGGGADAGDSDAVATALREAHEEIGLEPAAVEVLGLLDSYITRTGYQVQPVVGLITGAPAWVPDDFEVAEIFDVPLDHIRCAGTIAEKAIAVKGAPHRTYACTWNGFDLGRDSWHAAPFYRGDRRMTAPEDDKKNDSGASDAARGTATVMGKLAPQAWMQTEETRRVMTALNDATAGAARFVGGCVRDALSNRKVVDIDIATALPPENVIEKLKAAKIPYAPTGLKHGTVTAIVEGKPFEITTLRIDVLTFGRHAEVKYTDDWKTDAARRDFTFNAMSATVDGTVYDYFGGIEDLREGRVKFVGDPARRITEDVLRILRYFRFLAHFGRGTPDAEALRACRNQAADLTKLSPERIRQETLRLLESDNSSQVWQLMLQAGIVTHFLSEATDVKALEHLILLEKSYDEPVFPLRRLAALLDITPEGIERVADSLRLSNLQREHLREMTHPAPDVSLDMDMAAVRRAVYRRGNDALRSLLLLAAARAHTLHNLPELFSEATSFRPPRFPVNGGDVIALGWTAGPDVGYVLSALEAWWVERDFKPGRTACLEMLRNYATR